MNHGARVEENNPHAWHLHSVINVHGNQTIADSIHCNVKIEQVSAPTCSNVISFCVHYTCNAIAHIQHIVGRYTKSNVIANFHSDATRCRLTVKSVGKKSSRSFPSYRYIISADSRLVVGRLVGWYTLRRAHM